MNNKNSLNNKQLQKENIKDIKKSELIAQEIKEQVFYNDGLILI